jgi:hypothetical protein
LLASSRLQCQKQRRFPETEICERDEVIQEAAGHVGISAVISIDLIGSK